MMKYKKLIFLLVVFGGIHLAFTGTIVPSVSKWLMQQGLKPETVSDQLSLIFLIVQYSPVIIWLPVSIWIYKDAKKLEFAPWLWAILILLAHYQGLIIYLLIQLLGEKEKAEMMTPDKGVDTDAA